jgi:hypothetical protein
MNLNLVLSPGEKKRFNSKLSTAAKLIDGSTIGIDTRGKHDKLLYKDLKVPIPRHHEISEGTTRAIFQAFEGYFGRID